jgi:hypothetical protein
MLAFFLMIVPVVAVTSSLNSAPAASVLDPKKAAVLPVDAALIENSLRVSDVLDPPTVLNQCSRLSIADRLIVQLPRATFAPTQAEIAALEPRLNTLLADRLEAFRESHPREEWRTPQVSDYYRQYSAFDVAGWRLIYVNGFGFRSPNDAAGDSDWRQKPFIACDGGQCCFGVEYYPAIDAFANFQFNGTFSGPTRLRR